MNITQYEHHDCKIEEDGCCSVCRAWFAQKKYEPVCRQNDCEEDKCKCPPIPTVAEVKCAYCGDVIPNRVNIYYGGTVKPRCTTCKARRAREYYHKNKANRLTTNSKKDTL